MHPVYEYTIMEIEGFGVSLTGRAVWVAQGHQIPWEFLRDGAAMRILVRGPSVAETEADPAWTCVWTPGHARDWSCIATCIKSIGSGSCLLVFDNISKDAIPWSFWQYIDSIQTHIRLTRVWINEDPPTFVPDAVFFPPMTTDAARTALAILSALPARGGHGTWTHREDTWDAIVDATREQGMGLVVSDVEESEWTLMWHRPDDSRPSLEKRVAKLAALMRNGLSVLT